MGGRGAVRAGRAVGRGSGAGQGGGGGRQGGGAGSLVADGLTLGRPTGVGALGGCGCCGQGKSLAGRLDAVLEGERTILHKRGVGVKRKRPKRQPSNPGYPPGLHQEERGVELSKGRQD